MLTSTPAGIQGRHLNPGDLKFSERGQLRHGCQRIEEIRRRGPWGSHSQLFLCLVQRTLEWYISGEIG